MLVIMKSAMVFQARHCFNSFDHGWFPCAAMHGSRVVLVGNSNAVCFCRKQKPLGIFLV